MLCNMKISYKNYQNLHKRCFDITHSRTFLEIFKKYKKFLNLKNFQNRLKEKLNKIQSLQT